MNVGVKTPIPSTPTMPPPSSATAPPKLGCVPTGVVPMIGAFVVAWKVNAIMGVRCHSADAGRAPASERATASTPAIRTGPMGLGDQLQEDRRVKRFRDVSQVELKRRT